LYENSEFGKSLSGDGDDDNNNDKSNDLQAVAQAVIQEREHLNQKV